MKELYAVRLSKDYFVFSAGHFITYNGDVCERLHGHNYRVAAEIQGSLDENHYVIDFILVRDALKSIVDELDHHMLLPLQHKQIKLAVNEKEVEARFEDRRWIFPLCDCILLPLANTTTELLAKYIGERLLTIIDAKTGARPKYIRIDVDECEGQIGSCEMTED